MTYDNAEDVLSQVQDVTEFLGIELTDVNQKGIFGNSPLAVVISWGDLEAVSCLIEARADVDARNENGDTALHRAVLFDNLAIVDCLVAANASLSIKNEDGSTPFDLAKVLGHEAVAARLKRRS